MPIEDARVVVKAAWERGFFSDLVGAQITDLAYADKLQVHTDSLVNVRTTERDLYKDKADYKDMLYQGAQRETKVIKKQKRKWVVIALGATVVAVVELVVLVAQATQD